MKKLILSFVCIVATTITLSAKSYYFFDNRSSEFLPEQTALVENPQSPCNQGAEAFSTFIEKWNSSATFRTQRLKVTSETWSDGTSKLAYMKSCLQYLDANYVLPVAPVAKIEKDGYSIMKTYYGISADRVGYIVDQVSINGEVQDSQAILGFSRIAGKWYLVCIVYASESFWE